MSEPIRPTQLQLREIREAREANVINMSELSKLLAAGANPDTIASLKQDYENEIARIDKFLAVYDVD